MSWQYEEHGAHEGCVIGYVARDGCAPEAGLYRELRAAPPVGVLRLGEAAHCGQEVLMHHSRLSTFVLDCKVEDLEAAAAFWSEALGRPVLPPEPDEPNYLQLASSDDEPLLGVQKVDHDSRIHLDIETDDMEAEVARLEQLGARRIKFVKRWWLMQAPTGQVFCVLNPQRGSLADKPNVKRWP